MHLKLRRIGGSRGVILPDLVATRISGKTIQGYVLDTPYEEGAIFDTSEIYLELTNIGKTIVLSNGEPDELELRAAFAYASVKWRRRRLLERLAKQEPSTGERRTRLARRVKR